jgi:glycosyltransferase involved in cell wall biosynthesis
MIASVAMRSPPQIVHVMGWRSQQYGSFERFLVALARRCGEEGAVTHLVFHEPPTSRRFVADVQAEIHVVPQARHIGDPCNLGRLGSLLRRVGATHLHAHFGYDAYNALAVAHLLGVQRRFTTKHIMPSGSWRELPSLRHRWLAHEVEVFWAVSASTAVRLHDLGVPDSKIEVCHLGVDVEAYRADPQLRASTRAALGVQERTRLVLSASHLRPGKGTEVLPQLAAALAHDPGDVALLAAGGGVLSTRLLADARDLGLTQDNFRLLGVREDIPALLAAADLFIFPTEANEGMGLGALEAMAAGVPLVASAVSDLGQLPADTARLVPPGDMRALLAACRTLLADPEDAGARAVRSRQLVVERFSVASAVEAHLRHYLMPRPQA